MIPQELVPGENVRRHMTLLLLAARVDPHLRAAAQAVSDYIEATIPKVELLEAEVERLWEALDDVDDRIATAKWNLEQCGTDCNDWFRAIDRIEEAQVLIISAVLAGEPS